MAANTASHFRLVVDWSLYRRCSDVLTSVKKSGCNYYRFHFGWTGTFSEASQFFEKVAVAVVAVVAVVAKVAGGWDFVSSSGETCRSEVTAVVSSWACSTLLVCWPPWWCLVRSASQAPQHLHRTL